MLKKASKEKGYWDILTWRSAMMSSSTSEARHHGSCHDSHVPREPYNVQSVKPEIMSS